MTANPPIFTNSLSACIYNFTACKLHNSLFVSITKNCHSMRCEISCAAWHFLVCAHKFSLAEGNFEEKSPFVQANYRSIRHEILCKLSSELSSKNHWNKQRNSCISLALLLHNTVYQKYYQLLVTFKQSLTYLFNLPRLTSPQLLCPLGK